MGMGEPLLNTKSLVKAIRLLTAPQGIAIPTRRITVSTAGIIPGIHTLAKADLGVNLAISLNAARFLGLDHERGRIAPGFRVDFAVLDERLIPRLERLGVLKD